MDNGILKEMNDGCLKTIVDNVSIGQAFEHVLLNTWYL